MFHACEPSSSQHALVLPMCGPAALLGLTDSAVCPAAHLPPWLVNVRASPSFVAANMPAHGEPGRSDWREVKPAGALPTLCS